MAEIALSIGGRDHVVACRDGEEPQLRALGRLLDRHAPAAARAAGSPGGERMMLFLALILADEFSESGAAAPAPSPAPAPARDDRLERLADRLEALAAALEQTPATS